MSKISVFVKKIVDPDIRKLAKAGFLDETLSLTSRGRSAMNSIIMEKYKREMLVLADEQIEEDKEDDE